MIETKTTNGTTMYLNKDNIIRVTETPTGYYVLFLNNNEVFVPKEQNADFVSKVK